MSDATETARPVPRANIRRFDVFAEYNRVKQQQKGKPEDVAKGYGLWLAKLVAARKFAASPVTRAAVNEALGKGNRLAEETETSESEPRFRELEGVPQTGELFDREIVARMGSDFYREVFAPAIAEAVAKRESYEAIRDRLRVRWNLRKRAL